MRPARLAVLFATLLGPLRCHGDAVPYRIVNGSVTDIAEYPFLVSLQRWELETMTHICGGTLISDLWILTAGHCVREIEAKESGIVRVESTYYASGGTLLTINRTVRHENFRTGRTGIDFDFGLVRLTTSFGRAVPVRLIADRRRFPAGELCTVVGWGITKGTGNRDQLRAVRLPVVRQNDCANIYDEIEPITSRMVCAGYAGGGRDSCEGDSGGPLLCRGVQAGIISWGLGCAKPNRYGVYSDIGNQRSWIRKYTGV